MNIDRDAIADRLGFTRNDFDMLLTMFNTNANTSLKDMQKMIELNDMQGIIDTAHAISGGAGTLGLDDVYQLSMKVELAAKRGEDIDYHLYHKHLKELVDTL